MKAILSKDGREAFGRALHHFPRAPGWTRLQSPLHHLDSYQIQEHARASIIFPLLLWRYMQTNWVSQSFLEALVYVLGPDSRHPRREITRTFAAIAKSNSLMAFPSISKTDRDELDKTVKLARSRLQCLFKAAIVSSDGKTTEIVRPGNSADLPQTQLDSGLAPALVTVPIWEITDASRLSKTGQYWLRALHRPNIHLGVHVQEEAREYAVPWNYNVLAGEDKHRFEPTFSLTTRLPWNFTPPGRADSYILTICLVFSSSRWLRRITAISSVPFYSRNCFDVHSASTSMVHMIKAIQARLRQYKRLLVSVPMSLQNFSPFLKMKYYLLPRLRTLERKASSNHPCH